jgi:hypothetical protein
MSEQVRVLVTGAGGFIGHHLTKYRTYHWIAGQLKEHEAPVAVTA